MRSRCNEELMSVIAGTERGTNERNERPNDAQSFFARKIAPLLSYETKGIAWDSVRASERSYCVLTRPAVMTETEPRMRPEIATELNGNLIETARLQDCETARDSRSNLRTRSRRHTEVLQKIVNGSLFSRENR